MGHELLGVPLKEIRKLAEKGAIHLERGDVLLDSSSYTRDERIEDIKSFLVRFHPSKRVHIRMISSGETGERPKILNGFFDDLDKLATVVTSYNSNEVEKWNVYFGVNEISDTVSCSNVMKGGRGIRHDEIDYITTVCIDIDPVEKMRPAPASSVYAAVAAADHITQTLRKQFSIPPGMMTCSGNGVQMFWRCNVKNDHFDVGADFGQKFVWYVNQYISNYCPDFSSFNVLIDPKVGSVSQIMRLPGTINWKDKMDGARLLENRVANTLTNRAMTSIQEETVEMIEDAYEKHIKEHSAKSERAEDWPQEDVDNVDQYIPRETRFARAVEYVRKFDEVKYNGLKTNKEIRETPEELHSRKCYFWKKVSAVKRGFLLSLEEAMDIMDREWNQIKCIPPLSDRDMHMQSKGASRYTHMALGGLLGDPPSDSRALRELLKEEYKLGIKRSQDEVVRAFSNSQVAGMMVRQNRDNIDVMNKSRDMSLKLPIELCYAPGQDNIINDLFEYFRGITPGSDPTAAPFTAALAMMASITGKYYSPPLIGNAEKGVIKKSHTGLYILNVSGSGVGKSSCIEEIRSVMMKMGMRCFFGGDSFISIQQLTESLALRTGCGAIYAVDEMGDKMGATVSGASHASNLFNSIREYYTCGDRPATVAATARKRMQDLGIPINKGGTINLVRPSLTIYGGMTGDQLSKIAFKENRENGQVNRLMVFSDGLSADTSDIEGMRNMFDVYGVMPKDAGDGDKIPKNIVDFFEKVINVSMSNLDESNIDQYENSKNLFLNDNDPMAKFDCLQDIIFSDEMVNVVSPTEDCLVVMFEHQKNQARLSKYFTEKMGMQKLSDDIARMNENALRLASLSAIGRDPVRPVMTSNDFVWATKVVSYCVRTLMKLAGVSAPESMDASFSEKKYNKVVKIVREKYLAQAKNNESKKKLGPDDIDGASTMVYLTRTDLKNANRDAGLKDEDDPLLRILRLAHENGDVVLLEGEDATTFIEYFRGKEETIKAKTRGKKTDFILLPVLKNKNSIVLDTVKNYCELKNKSVGSRAASIVSSVTTKHVRSITDSSKILRLREC